jgi:hypothetical protein
MTHEDAIEAVAHCGVPRSHIRVSYDDELQSDVISIGPLPETPSEETMRCMARSVLRVGYHVEFQNIDQNSEFWALITEDGRQQARAEGEQWLQDRGLYENMPRYSAAEAAPAEFARTVEAYCGLEVGSAIQLVEGNILSPRPDFLQKLIRGDDSSLRDKFTCLRNVLAASNMAVGIVGAEAFSAEGETE